MKKNKNKKVSKMKKIYFIPIFIFVCIFSYVLVKCFYLNYYKIDYKEIKNIIKGVKIENTITVNRKELKEEEYLQFNEIKLENIFGNFTLGENSNEQNFKEYFLYDENDSIKAGFMMSKYSTYTNIFKSQDVAFFLSDNKDKKKMKNLAISEYMKKSKINNDVDLLKYLQSPKMEKDNLFTKVEDMKNKYGFYKLVSISLPSSKSITLLDGDYKGYIFNTNNLKEVNILMNDYRYVFTLIKLDYFTDEVIYDLLNSIVIEEI